MDAQILVESAGKSLIRITNRYLKAQICLRQAKTLREQCEASAKAENLRYELEKRKADIEALNALAQSGKLIGIFGGNNRNECGQAILTVQQILGIRDSSARRIIGRAIFGDDWDKLIGEASGTDGARRPT